MTTTTRTKPEAREELARLKAELSVLDEFDVQRASRGHDYGAGQRTRELRNLEREHEEALRRYKRTDPAGAFPPAPSKGDLVRAFNRSIMPRVQRARRGLADLEANGYIDRSAGARKAKRLRLVIEAARRTADRLDLEIDVDGDRELEELDKRHLELFHAGEHLTTLQMRGARHAAERAGDTAAERELADRIDVAEAKGETG